MNVRVMAFGVAKEIIGSDRLEVELEEGATAEVLHAKLSQQHPGLGRLTSFMIAVNNEYAPAGKTIAAGDEIAIIPPVSGG